MQNRGKLKGILYVLTLTYTILLFLMMFGYEYKDQILQFNNLVYLTFIINIIFSFVNLLYSTNRPFSLEIVFWFFNCLFLSITPLLQYSTNTFVLKNITFQDATFIQMNLLILMYMYVFKLFYKYSYNGFIRTWTIFIKNTAKNNVTLNTIILLLVLIICILSLGFNNMFFRGASYSQLNSSFDYLIIEVITYMSVFITLLFYERYSGSPSFIKYLILLILLMYNLTIVFPTSRARFFVATIYIGYFLYFRRNHLNKFQFILLLCLLFAVLAPVSTTFRGLLEFNQLNKIHFSSSIYEYFIEGDFSSYTMGMATLQYVENNGYLFGQQMLSNLFFIVPGEIWQSKMPSLGATIATYSMHTHGNMDSPLVAEFYVDFGFIGTIIFTVILALICKKIDETYWRMNPQLNTLIKYIYPYLVVIFLFINRGALLSTFSRSFNLVLGFTVIGLLYLSEIKKVNLNNGKEGRNNK